MANSPGTGNTQAQFASSEALARASSTGRRVGRRKESTLVGQGRKSKLYLPFLEIQ